MKNYIVPVSYTVSGYIMIPADSAQEARDAANANIARLPLPKATQYVEDSYLVEEDAGSIEMATRIYDEGRLRLEPTAVLQDKNAGYGTKGAQNP